jgi:hypothetical protein
VDDLVVSSTFGNGVVYIIFGNPEYSSNTIDVTQLHVDSIIEIPGLELNSILGFRMHVADINNDGKKALMHLPP